MLRYAHARLRFFKLLMDSKCSGTVIRLYQRRFSKLSFDYFTAVCVLIFSMYRAISYNNSTFKMGHKIQIFVLVLDVLYTRTRNIRVCCGYLIYSEALCLS